MKKELIYGEKLLQGKTDDFKTEAIVRFTEFDRLTALSGDNDFFVIGYPVIVANLEGEHLKREEDLDNKAREAQAMMKKLKQTFEGL